MLPIDDTIVALSTAAGPGGRAVVRLSGPEAVALARTVFHSAAPPPPRGVVAGFLQLTGFAAAVPAELHAYAAPRSYTGQAAAELHFLSSPPLVDQALADLIRAGARPAAPGEFTLRAFLAGKINLAEAEGALAAIEAVSRDELRSALKQLAGGLSRPLDGLRDSLLDLLADLEAALDFVDEDIEFVPPDQALNRLADAMARVTLVRKQAEGRGLADRAFRVALVGPPNAGKSRLFNALTGGAALVSPEAGTTRDYLTARVTHHGMELEFVDTAGQRQTADAIEARAQQLGAAAAASADLVLHCRDASSLNWTAPALSRSAWLVATKCDLAPAPRGARATSAETGLGISDLIASVADAARRRSERGFAPTLSRCRGHLDACLESLRRAHRGVLENDPPEVVAADLRSALDELGQLTGAIHSEDLLDRVFSRFCVGK
jgi:tRNA modification GTPase